MGVTENVFDLATLMGGDVKSLLARPNPMPGRIREALANRVTTPMNIVGVGSSTMAGGGASISSENYFFNRFIRMLQAAYPNFIPNTGESAVGTLDSAVQTVQGVHGYRGGVTSTNSGNYLDATTLAKVQALSPSVVMHVMGSNDMNEGRAIAVYKANMQSWINQIKANTPNVHQVLIHSFQRSDKTPDFVQWARYGQALREIAETTPNVSFVDVSRPFYEIGIAPNSEYGNDPFGIMGDDLIHVRNLGHFIMADEVRSRLGIPWAENYVPLNGTALPVASGGGGGVFAFLPPVGWTAGPQSYTAGAAGNLQWQRLGWYAVPYQAMNVDQIQVNVTTAFSGGTNPVLLIGIYADDGTGSPNFPAGPVFSGSLSLTNLGTGRQGINLSPNGKIPSAGIYWVVTLYTGDAAASAGQLTCMTNTAYQIPAPTNVGPNTPTRAYVRTGVTALPVAATTPTSISGATDTPGVYLRRAA